MKHLFVSYEIAIELKENGFNDPCFAEYRQWDGNIPYLAIYQDDNEENTESFTTECIAPLYQQAIDWCIIKLARIFVRPRIIYNIYHIGNWVVEDRDGDDFLVRNFNNLDQAIEMAISIIKEVKITINEQGNN